MRTEFRLSCVLDGGDIYRRAFPNDERAELHARWLASRGYSAVTIEQWQVPEESDYHAALSEAREVLTAIRRLGTGGVLDLAGVTRVAGETLAKIDVCERRIGEPRRITLDTASAG